MEYVSHLPLNNAVRYPTGGCVYTMFLKHTAPLWGRILYTQKTKAVETCVAACFVFDYDPFHFGSITD